MSRGCFAENDIAAGLRTFGQPYISKGGGDVPPTDMRFGNRRFAYDWNADNAFNFRRPRGGCGLDSFESNHAADFSQIVTGPTHNDTMPGHCAARTPSQYWDLHVQDPIMMRGAVPTDQVQNPRYIPSTVAKSLGIRGESPTLQKIRNESYYWQTVNKQL